MQQRENTMRQTRKLGVAVAILLASGSIHQTEGFDLGGGLSARPFGKARSIRRHHIKQRTSKLSMYIDDNDENRFTFTLSSPLLASSSSSAFPVFALSTSFSPSSLPTDFPSSQFLSHNPLVEAEFFSDAAHLALDFASVFGPTTVVVRLAAVIGRIFAIASDYLPDHAMFPEEFIFQMSMLVLSGSLLVKSAIPMALSSSADLSFQDRRTFCALFDPFGVKWHQYKALAAMALDWVTVEAGQSVTASEQVPDGSDGSPSCMYWLYSGDVAVLSGNGKVVHNVSRSNGVLSASNAAKGLLGEMHFVQSLEKSKSKASESPSSKTVIQAGPNGATLLRINTNKLSMLMENDEQLAKAIRSLVVKSMHDKLSSFLEA